MLVPQEAVLPDLITFLDSPPTYNNAGVIWSLERISRQVHQEEVTTAQARGAT